MPMPKVPIVPKLPTALSPAILFGTIGNFGIGIDTLKQARVTAHASAPLVDFRVNLVVLARAPEGHPILGRHKPHPPGFPQHL